MKLWELERTMKSSVFLLKMLFLALCFTSCISFDFGSLKDQTASGVVFQPPSSPYKKVIKKGMDLAWENPKTGDTLSFFSNCSTAVEFSSVAHFQKELLDGLKKFRVLSQRRGLHQGLRARFVSLKQLSSSPEKMNMRLFLFKKENCFYAVSFLTVPSAKADSPGRQKVFEKFIREFRAP